MPAQKLVLQKVLQHSLLQCPITNNVSVTARALLKGGYGSEIFLCTLQLSDVRETQKNVVPIVGQKTRQCEHMHIYFEQN